MATLCRLDVFLLFTFLNIISNSRYYAGIVAVGSEAAGHLQAVVYHQQHGGGHERPARFFVLAVDYGHLKA